MDEQQITLPIKDVQPPIELLSNDGEITLRQFSPKDSEDIFSLIDQNRGHLSQFGDDTAEKYKTLESVRESIEHPKNPKRLRFGIRNKQGIFVGSINLTPDKDNPKYAEIGYYLGEEFQNQGYMYRAVYLLTTYGFQNLKYDLIYGDVTENNISSSKVLLKAGYVETEKHDGKIHYTKQNASNIRHHFDKDLTPSFEKFLPFVHVADEQIKQRFIVVLKELFKETGNVWYPGSCYSTEYLTKIVKQLQSNQKLTGIEFKPMSWKNAHFYLTARINKESQPLIIDPFGVPKSGVSEDVWMKDKGTITPYFGDIESAPKSHQDIYSTAEPVADRGFYHFHP